MEKYMNIAGHFAVSGTPSGIAVLGAGHINDSFVLRTQESDKPDYLLQRINHHIFKDVDMLQNNIKQVTEHIRKKLTEKGETDIDRKVMTIVPAKDGKLYHFDGENYWRIYVFIEGSKSFDAINAPLAYEAGKAFGDFQSYLADLPTELGETIPDFHNMEFRLEQFRQAVKDDLVGRVQSNRELIDEIEKRADEMCLPNRLYREGKLPKRTNHCDTKVNNILFDDKGNVLCVVDLDTVMPGFVLSDFGDFMRTGANTGAEDDADLNNIGIDLEIFAAYAKGYAEKTGDFLLPVEKENLAFGAKLLTYMQTVRFFTDYLNGDTYYKIHFPEHNLQRTKAQLKLLQDMEAHYGEMCRIVKEAYGK
ncbi:MAG: aminoglycoside phosphotransferase family protein [Prevotella sp.]|jgi:Ser/Thr protein kinase RdoA (MazF antagonist)|nr:aminoglycoside phosphotransferase family protein [Prevotella sp.]